ncbi:hypothetical protein O9992_01330 [Vibrio lentus]|nr:hypothetical protein [Vibrio lentus]
MSVLGQAFNEMVKNGELKAPVVIGRDHLDSGSVSKPEPRDRRHDGWIRCRIRLASIERSLNTGGATWVSLHHGGGVGMGLSQHSGW